MVTLRQYTSCWRCPAFPMQFAAVLPARRRVLFEAILKLYFSSARRLSIEQALANEFQEHGGLLLTRVVLEAYRDQTITLRDSGHTCDILPVHKLFAFWITRRGSP
jgi:hypothetical protein